MKMVGDIFTLMVIAVIIYLFLNKGDTSVALINESGKAISNTFKTLQGR